MSEILQTEYKYKESPYKFIKLNDGFHITGSERCPVDVRLVNNGKALLVESNGEFHQLGLFQYYRLVELIAKLLLANWTPRGEKYYPDWLRFWGRNNTSRSIYKRVHAQWQRLLTMADPLAIQVQRAIFAATRNTAILAIEDEMYQNYWLINDIQNYRAAALATVKIESILWYRNRTLREAQVYRFKYEFYSQKSLDRSWCALSTRPPLMIDRTYQLGFLQEWRNLFSFNGRAYHSLNRTLMNLPGGIPIYFLPSLADIELPRPITNRLELSLVLATLNNRIIENLPIILYAQADQEKYTMELLAAHLNRELSHRRWHDIRLLAMYLSDYPEKHTGNIVGLIKKSIDWHREQAAMDVLQVIDK